MLEIERIQKRFQALFYCLKPFFLTILTSYISLFYSSFYQSCNEESNYKINPLSSAFDASLSLERLKKVLNAIPIIIAIIK